MSLCTKYTLVCMLASMFCVGAALRFDNYTFGMYKQAFGRTYPEGSVEHDLRRTQFEKNLVDILVHNQKGASWQMGVNEFTDRTPAEMKTLYGYRRSPPKVDAADSLLLIRQNADGSGSPINMNIMCASMSSSCSSTPCCSEFVCGRDATCVKPQAYGESFDWSESPALARTAHRIHNQRHCGSCWAVAATAALETHAIMNGHHDLPQLSPETLVKCTPNPMHCGGDGGCAGATSELAFSFVKSQYPRGAVFLEQDLSYTATDGKCPIILSESTGTSFLQPKVERREGPSIAIKGQVQLIPNDAHLLTKHLVTAGPVVGTIVGSVLQHYKSGVISACDSWAVDHAVLFMGFGKDHNTGMPYWKIRNSWGGDWGEGGYFRVKRAEKGAEEPCGWDMDPKVGVACEDKDGKYPEKQWTCGVCGVLSDSVYPVGTTVIGM